MRKFEIETIKSYKLTLTEQQAKELYEFLHRAKDVGHLSVDRDLILIYNELKDIFGKESGMFAGGVR